MPELRNSPKLSTPERVKADPFGGTASYAYRFDLPPGTGGLTPELVLTYSTQTRNTEVGYGWSLNIPYIERSTRLRGPAYHNPAVDGGDVFELEGDLLARVPGDPTRFHRRFADGSRIRYRSAGSNNYWEVTRPDGTQLFFGQTANARLHRNGDTKAETFRWSLSEVRDLRGNSYRISYLTDDDNAGGIAYKSFIYPQRITYSHHVSAPAPQRLRVVELAWGARLDTPTSYRAGFKLQQRLRLTEVRVGIDEGGNGTLDETVRRYELSYYAPPSNESEETKSLPPYSQLGAIQRYGSDDTAFPSATEFRYTRPARAFESVAQLGWQPGEDSVKGLTWDEGRRPRRGSRPANS
jgi:hypothetical protein